MVSEKIKLTLVQDYNFRVFRIIESYIEFNKTYMVFVFFEKTDELQLITEELKTRVKSICIDCLRNEGCFPTEVIVYFDSDENVKKKYNGNYFYATR